MTGEPVLRIPNHMSVLTSGLTPCAMSFYGLLTDAQRNVPTIIRSHRVTLPP